MTKTRLQIFDQMQKHDERIAVVKEQIARAQPDKATDPVVCSQWQTDLKRLQRERQRLQFEMGEAKRQEKQGGR
jgi:hypothetical protein